MNFDQQMRKQIAEAEANTPHVDTKYTVIAEAQEDFKSDDERQYEYLYTRLPRSQKKSLAHDYIAYQVLHSTCQSLLSDAQNCLLNAGMIEPGPLLSRLTRPVVRPPSKWRICGICNGSGDSPEIAKCNACGGHGYFV